MIQEKLAQAFSSIKNAKFGEIKVDTEAAKAEKQLTKDPTKLNVEQSRTLLTLDITKMFGSIKGANELRRTLRRLETTYPQGNVNTWISTDIDTINSELERSLNQLNAENATENAALFEGVGKLLAKKDYRGAAQLLREEVDAAKRNREISQAQQDVLTPAIDAMDAGQLVPMRNELNSLRTNEEMLREDRRDGVNAMNEKAEHYATITTRRSIALLKRQNVDDINSRLWAGQNIADELQEGGQIPTELGALPGRHDIVLGDLQTLRRFRSDVIGGDPNRIVNGVSLEDWSRKGDPLQRQRMLRETNAVVNHILLLQRQGRLPALSNETLEYLKEVQRATGAVKRIWREDQVHQGESGIPRRVMTPAEKQAAEVSKGNTDFLSQFKTREAFTNWAQSNRNWNIGQEVVDTETGFSLQSELARLVSEGKIQDPQETGGQIVWLGSDRQFFDEVAALARRVSKIVPEVNQIPFSRSPYARLYQTLMESEAPAGKKGDLGGAKDAVFRLYTAGYVKESVWRNGGNIESMMKAGLGLLGQGDDYSVFASQWYYNERVVDIEGTGADIIRIDLRDMMDFVEHYSRIKDDKRSWLNAISAGELNMDISDASSKLQRMEFFHDYMGWVLERQLDMGEITQAQYNARKTLVDDRARGGALERTFDVYGDDYTNLVKVLYSITLRYPEVAVNQNIEGDGFDFVSPPGGEAPFKHHYKTVFKFIAKYIPTNKFAAWLDRSPVGMNSLFAFAKGEMLPHFLQGSNANNTAANPGADLYFFRHLGRNSSAAQKFAEFWKPAIMDSDDNPGGKPMDMDEIRMIADIKEKALAQLDSWSGNKLDFVNEIDYTMISRNSGFDFEAIFQNKGITDPQEKFRYFVQHFGFRYFEPNGLRSKRVADWMLKYVPNAYATIYKSAIALSLNPNSDETIFELSTAMTDLGNPKEFIRDMHNRVKPMVNHEPNLFGIPLPPLPGLGVRMPKTEGGKGWANVEERGERSAINLQGKKESSLSGILPGRLDRRSLVRFLTQRRDPDWMRPFILEQAYNAGQISPEIFEEMMIDYKGEMYFGKRIGNTNLRWGYIPPFTFLYMLRGWMVDKMHMDWDDVVYYTKKQNKETAGEAWKWAQDVFKAPFLTGK